MSAEREAKLSYNGNLLVENRHGLIVNTEVFEANGTAERDAALVMLEQIPGTKQVSVGGDKALIGRRNGDGKDARQNESKRGHLAKEIFKNHTQKPGYKGRFILDCRVDVHPAGVERDSWRSYTVADCCRLGLMVTAIASGSAFVLALVS